MKIGNQESGFLTEKPTLDSEVLNLTYVGPFKKGGYIRDEIPEGNRVKFMIQSGSSIEKYGKFYNWPDGKAVVEEESAKSIIERFKEEAQRKKAKTSTEI
jgi:hypothetical protein